MIKRFNEWLGKNYLSNMNKFNFWANLVSVVLIAACSLDGYFLYLAGQYVNAFFIALVAAFNAYMIYERFTNITYLNNIGALMAQSEKNIKTIQDDFIQELTDMGFKPAKEIMNTSTKIH